ncbi:MAG: hypothetical protein WD029_00360 [Microthrixaceae bacterium]
MTEDELLAEACPQIRDLGWTHYFVSETMARGTELGLDGFKFYFLGRGGVLGDVDASMVQAAFGYFEPTVLADAWTSGGQIVAPSLAAAAFHECAAEHGRRRLTGVEELEAFVAAADQIVDAADATALTLYAGALRMPLVQDLPGRAMQLISLLREFRGSAHLLALRAIGLDSVKAHAISRPHDMAMFGWADDAAGEITDLHREQREEAELLTDEVVLPAYMSLDDEGQTALLSGLSRIGPLLTAP